MDEVRDWADVFVKKDRARDEIERAALFFVPKFYDVAEQRGLTVNLLSGAAGSLKKKFKNLEIAGRAALTIIHHGEQAASYKAAVGSINVINDLVEQNARLSSRDIVACVFRLRDGPQIAEAVGSDFSDFVAETGLSVEIVRAALTRHRITYADAHIIWSAAWKRCQKSPDRFSEAKYLTDDESHLIVVDNRTDYPRRLYHLSYDDTDTRTTEQRWIYNRNNVRAAPLNGHKWALMSP